MENMENRVHQLKMPLNVCTNNNNSYKYIFKLEVTADINLPEIDGWRGR